MKAVVYTKYGPPDVEKGHKRGNVVIEKSAKFREQGAF